MTGTVSPYTAPTAITRLLCTVIKPVLPGDRASQSRGSALYLGKSGIRMVICARKLDFFTETF